MKVATVINYNKKTFKILIVINIDASFIIYHLRSTMKTTEQLLHEIKTSSQYIPLDSQLNTDIYIFLKDKLQNENLKLLFTKLDIDPNSGYKYINGTRNINRDTFLKILIYLGYDFTQIQQCLNTFQFPILYAKNKRDAAIIYAIYNEYNYYQLKKYLQDHNIKLL